MLRFPRSPKARDLGHSSASKALEVGGQLPLRLILSAEAPNAMPTPDKFTFRKHDSIGAAAAEEDAKFLAQCFVDNGDIELLADCSDRRRIVLGRTGAGKSALLSRLTEDADVIVINPETLSFNYLANSTILQFFIEIGVKMDLFFKLLWRHVFTVELLRHRYNLRTRIETTTLIDRFKSHFVQDPHKERAIQYLTKWGEHFWEDTEYRIKEITSKLEEDLTAGAKAKLPIAEFGVGAASKLTEEQKLEVIQHGKSVINNIQMRELTDVLRFLNEDVFADGGDPLFICIDRLDENWVDESFRYLLIRSLIETIRDFLQVRNVKIVAALRTDLIERVFRYTRDPGFQEEKYRSLFLPLKWTKQQLLQMLDKRVNLLVRQTYTKQQVGYKDILPTKIDKNKDAAGYLVERTLMRPRDLIEFFNHIVEDAAGKATITRELIVNGEGTYSKNRLRSLQDEWISDYPSLIECSSLLKQKPKAFRLNSFLREDVEEFCLNYSIDNRGRSRADLLSVQANAVADGIVPWEVFIRSMIHVFYITGVVGLKTEAFESYQWAHEGPSTVIADTIGMDTSAMVHPMFHRVLGIRPDR